MSAPLACRHNQKALLSCVWGGTPKLDFPTVTTLSPQISYHQGAGIPTGNLRDIQGPTLWPYLSQYHPDMTLNGPFWGNTTGTWEFDKPVFKSWLHGTLPSLSLNSIVYKIEEITGWALRELMLPNLHTQVSVDAAVTTVAWTSLTCKSDVLQDLKLFEHAHDGTVENLTP